MSGRIFKTKNGRKYKLVRDKGVTLKSGRYISGILRRVYLEPVKRDKKEEK